MTDRSPEARLRQLIEQWRENAAHDAEDFEHEAAFAIETCANELEALLTEDAVTRPKETLDVRVANEARRIGGSRTHLQDVEALIEFGRWERSSR